MGVMHSFRGTTRKIPPQKGRVAVTAETTVQSRNVAARMGRWSAAHWKTATFGWLIFVLVAFALAGMVGTKSLNTNTQGPGQSGRMDKILDAGFKRPAGEVVLIQSSSQTASDPAFKAAVDDVVARVSKVAGVQNVRSPLDPAAPVLIAKNGHAALVEFRDPRRQGQGSREDRPRRRAGRGGAAGPSGLLHRRVR